MQASGDYFATLGIKPERGRLFQRADDFPGCPAVADISDGFWHSHFGGAASAVGAALMLSGHPFTVIGVTPAAFFGTNVGERFVVAVPLCTEAITSAMENLLPMRNAIWLNIMGRLRPGETLASASAGLVAEGPGLLAATVPPDYKPVMQASYRGQRLSAQPGGLGMSRLRSQYGLPLEILLAVAGLVLLVACANLAGLMLARAAARRQEIAVRLALGASRARLVRQLLTESLLLAAGGAALGAGFAARACRAMEQYLPGIAGGASLNLTPDARVLAFTMGLTAATALLVGLAPALRATRVSLAAGARQEVAPAGAVGHAIVAAQLALALVLLAGSGIFLRSFLNLAGVDTGFDPSQISLVELNPPTRKLPDAAMAAADEKDLEFLRALPGVSTASESFMVPTSGLQWDNTLQAATGPGNIPDAYFNAVSPGYFGALRTPLLEGRDFTADDTAAAVPVVILNATAAHELFPGGSALGARIRQPNAPDTQVVGVTEDAKYLSLRDDALPVAYYPLAQLPQAFSTTNYELRSALPAAALEREVRAAFAQSDPTASFRFSTLARLMAGTIKPERLLATLSALFGGLALLLSAIGLYGIMAYSASRRRQEFGIRMALGAQPRAIARLVLRDAAAMLAMGAAAGAALAWIGARSAQAALGKLLFGLQASDGATLAGAAALLVIVTLAAGYFPARRAAHADPMRALREE